MDQPEIRRGDFVYRDTLFVDVGSNKRHARASPQDLKALLFPKSGSSAPKDQVAHWYEAQLIHYGLPRSKDKNTAKVRLTNAITAKALAVPKEVISLESEMKKEYAGALRKAKGPVGKAETKETTKKAKSTTSKTTVELEIDGIKVKIDREAIEAAAKKATKSKEAAPKPKGAKVTTATPRSASAPKTPASKPATAKKSTAASPPRSAFASGAAQPMKKQTARRGTPFPDGAGTRPASTPSQPSDRPRYSFQGDTEMDDAPPAYESLGFDEDEELASPPAIQISGSYHFPRPAVRPFDLTLQIDKATQTLWGKFQVGSKEGVIFMNDISGITRGETLSFGWRSEDQDTATMKFGRGCDGTMRFDGDGWVQGRFRAFLYGEDVHFEGSLVNTEGLDPAEMKHAWDDFPRKAYYGRGQG